MLVILISYYTSLLVITTNYNDFVDKKNKNERLLGFELYTLSIRPRVTP